MIRLAPQHHAIHMLQVQIDFGFGLDAAVDDDFQMREVALETICGFIAQRRDFAVFLRTQPFQDRIARMHDESLAAGFGHRADKVAHEFITVDRIDADPVLDRHVDADRIAHRLDAIGHQLRLGHQAGAERAFLHPFGRAAAIEVDFVVAPLLAQFRALGQVVRFAAAQLQGDRMFF